MKFRGSLPISCPPPETKSPDQTILWRLLEGPEPTQKDFLSHAELNPNKTFYAENCRFHSVSLAISIENCRILTKLPRSNLKGRTHAVQVKFDPKAGVYHMNERNHHVDFWMAEGVIFTELIGRVEIL